MIKFNKIILFLVVIIFAISMNSNLLWSADPVILKIMWWGSQDRHDKTLKVIEMFQKENPDIKFEPIYTSWNGYYEKLATLVADNDMSDIVQMTIQNMPQYDEKGLFEDMLKIKSIDQRY